VHLEDMATEGTWGTTSEIFAAATLLQRDIFVFVRCQSGVYTWTRFKPLFVHEQIVQDIQLSNICSYISICNTDAVHFDIVHPLVGCNCHWPKPKLDGS
ncbi:OVARIAN TUMOR DOMAIN-containing deubiquitinating enzyme 6, partial [Biomphalaria glabrata]